MTDLRKNLTYTEGEEMMASCEIERIYPKPVDFTIRLGGSNGIAAVKENTDGSYKGIVNITKTLNMEDHNQNVSCEVTTKIEDSAVVKVTQTLKVECEYSIVTYFRNLRDVHIFPLCCLSPFPHECSF